MTLTLLSVPPPKGDCQDTQVCKLNSKEKLKLANPLSLRRMIPCAAIDLRDYDVCLRTLHWSYINAKPKFVEYLGNALLSHSAKGCVKPK